MDLRRRPEHAAGRLRQGVDFAPLEVWRYDSPSVLRSIALAVAFPALFALLYGSELRRPRLFAHTSVSVVVGIAIFALFAGAYIAKLIFIHFR